MAQIRYPVRYSDTALCDLDDIADWYEAQSAFAAALDVPDRIRANVRLLGEGAAAWPVGVSGFREWCLDVPFRVVYDFNGRYVTVLRVVHTRRAWPRR